MDSTGLQFILPCIRSEIHQDIHQRKLLLQK